MSTIVRAPKGHPWQLVGGHPALDFANTVAWRLDPARREDRLTDTGHLVDWLGALNETGAVDRNGVIGGVPGFQRIVASGREDRPQAEILDAVRTLRRAFTCVVDSVVEGTTSPMGDLHLVEIAWKQAIDRSSMTLSLPARWVVDLSTGADIVTFLGLTVGDFLQSADLSRLRRCDGQGCGWLFLDMTRNHSRKWCDPDDCGNRTRVRNYSRRRRQHPPAEIR